MTSCSYVYLLKSKLRQATVSSTELTYHGSITLPTALMEPVGLLPYEQLLIGNCKNAGTTGDEPGGVNSVRVQNTSCL